LRFLPSGGLSEDDKSQPSGGGCGMAIPGPFPARGPDRRTVTDRAGAGLAMSDHGQDACATSALAGQDACATSALALEGAVEEGLEKVVQAAAALGLAGFERPNFLDAGGELALEGQGGGGHNQR